jgi:hypothetical protein
VCSSDLRAVELNVSDYVIELKKEYEFVEEIGESGEVELWRKLCPEKIAERSSIPNKSDRNRLKK